MPPASQNTGLQPRRVLVVDDEAASRDTLCAQLAADEFDLITCNSGRDLLHRLPELAPDVILLDVMMSGLDGYELCRTLKQSPSYRHIPVMLITALDSVQDRVRGLEAGADEFMSKPVTRVELLARVRTMLRIKLQYDDLERMLELRQALSYMIVHDLRNPLAAVMLYLQLLKRRSGVAPDQVRYLDLALTESRKMSNFLDDMLMLAKMERGKLNLSRSPLFMERILANVREKFGPLAEAQGVILSVRPTEQPYAMTADVTLFQRVVENLVANALKFSPAQTTVTVVVDYPRLRTGGNCEDGLAHLSLSVHDQGRGIPAGRHGAHVRPV